MDCLVASTVNRVEVFVYQGGTSVQKDTFRDFYEARDCFEAGPDYAWSWMQMIVFFDLVILILKIIRKNKILFR